jgi:hypothetical protein
MFELERDRNGIRLRRPDHPRRAVHQQRQLDRQLPHPIGLEVSVSAAAPVEYDRPAAPAIIANAPLNTLTRAVSNALRESIFAPQLFMGHLHDALTKRSLRLAGLRLRHLTLAPLLGQPAVLLQTLLARLLSPALLGAIALQLILTPLLALVPPMLHAARLLLSPAGRLIALVLRALLLLDAAPLVLVALGVLLLLRAVTLASLLVARPVVVLALLLAGPLLLLMPGLLGLLARPLVLRVLFRAPAVFFGTPLGIVVG